MKKLLIYILAGLPVFTCNINSAHAQSASERHRAREQNKQDEQVFGDEDPQFKNTNIPAKWQNESAVVLATKVYYNYYTKSGGQYLVDQTIRVRIKLLDKAAVNDFNTFYFTDNLSGPTEAGFRIIKKDGTTDKVDLTKAVDQESTDNVPDYELLPGSYDKIVKYKKIAIGNLEPGDIIDYYYQYHNIILNGQMSSGPTQKAVGFPTEIFKLSGTFPIMYQRVDFQVERGFYINFGSYNGAPELQESNEVNHRVKVFSFIDSNREKETNERFEYYYRSEPTIKFQIVYSDTRDQNDVDYFLGQPFVPLTSVTEDMVQQVANHMALETDANAEKNAKEIVEYMKAHHGNVTDNAKYMEYAYYYFRYITLSKLLMTKYQFAQKLADEGGSIYVGERANYIDGSVSDEYFVKTMGLVCRDRNIPYDFLFTVPRTIGSLDNLLLMDETRWVLHIKGDKDVYFYPFDRFKNPNEGVGILEGADAYVISPNKNRRVSTLDRQKLPVSKYTDNAFSYNLDVTLPADMGGDVVVKRKGIITGEAKAYYYPDVLLEDQYENNDIARYRIDVSKDELTDNEFVDKIHNSQKHEEAERKLKTSIDEEIKDRLDQMKKDAEDDYSVDSYDDFKLIADGREMDSTTLIFTEGFKVKDMVKKAGPNYTINAGSLIGSQPNIKDTELTRHNDIYITYPANYTNQINITIPNGYKVSGIDNLNANVVTPAGGFIASASLSGNILTIKTQKYYAANYFPKSSWPDMVKFLQAAYDFSQKKILLKKA